MACQTMVNRAWSTCRSTSVKIKIVGFITLNAGGEAGTIQAVAKRTKLAFLSGGVDEVVVG